MATTIITMDKAGRIVLPKQIRKQLGVNPGSAFEAEVVLDRLELTPKEDPGRSGTVVRKEGLPVAARTGTAFSASEAVRQDREDRMEHLSERRKR
jgi:AbrB family looped-hinge helix DNA binding protein